MRRSNEYRANPQEQQFHRYGDAIIERFFDMTHAHKQNSMFIYKYVSLHKWFYIYLANVLSKVNKCQNSVEPIELTFCSLKDNIVKSYVTRPASFVVCDDGIVCQFLATTYYSPIPIRNVGDQ